MFFSQTFLNGVKPAAWLGRGLVVFSLLASVVYATEPVYPDKLNEGQPFLQLSDFQDIYQRIYQDVHAEDTGEILRRVREQMIIVPFADVVEAPTGEDQTPPCREGDFYQECRVGSLFSEQESDVLCDLGVPLVSHHKHFSQRKQQEVADEVRTLCQYEQELLRQENNRAREAGFLALFSDGDLAGEQRNSPFDVVVAMNRLDRVLFGEEKMGDQPPKASFLTYVPWVIPALGRHNFQPEPETPATQTELGDGYGWQDQREQTLKPLFDTKDGERYSDPENSIAGTLFAMLKPLDTLLGTSLTAEQGTCEAFESPALNPGFLGGPKFTATAYQVPPNDGDKVAPLVETTAETDINAAFAAVIQDQLTQSDCVETANQALLDPQQNNLVGADIFLSCEQRRTQQFETWYQSVREQTALGQVRAHFGRDGRRSVYGALQNWLQDLSAFYESAFKIRVILQIFDTCTPQVS